MDWDKATIELQKPLSPDAVRQPPKGKFGEYVDALHVIREANRIFGHGGWSYSITRIEMASRIMCKDKYDNDQVRISYACTVRVEVDGVSREGAAVGMGVQKVQNEADAHESAYKEAETDALKRALRSFGNTFGLALYDKDKSAREVGYAASESEIAAAIESLSGCASVDDLTASYKSIRASFPAVANDQRVIDAASARKKELAA